MTKKLVCSYCQSEFDTEVLALEHRKICPTEVSKIEADNQGKEYVFYGIILLFISYIGSQIWANEYDCNINNLTDYANCLENIVWWIRIFSFIELLGFCLCFWGIARMIELHPSNK